MEVNQQKAQAAKGCFDYNKKAEKVHVASDLQCFFNKTDAVNHARKLEDKTIDVFTRSESNEVSANEEDSKGATEESKADPNYQEAKNKRASQETTGGNQ